MKQSLSLAFVNLTTGGITHAPCSNDGVYLKSIVDNRDYGAFALYPTTTCLSVFNKMVFTSEMKLNIYKRVHPDYAQQIENTKRLLQCTGAEFAYSVNLTKATDKVAIVKKDGIYLGTDKFIKREDYQLFNREQQFEADAIITDQPNIALLMYAADCPTAFLHDRRTGAIGVLHSMWRGFVVPQEEGKLYSIVERTVEAMTSNYGTRPEDLNVTIFPCIGLNEFEVGEEVVEKFEQRGLSRHIYRSKDNQKAHIDLTGAMIELFERVGVSDTAIRSTPYRTADYGLNSFRQASKSYNCQSELVGDTTRDVITQSHSAPALVADEVLKRSEIRGSALNFLIAMRR